MIVVWSDMAIADRRDQLFHIADDNPFAAIEQGERIEASVDRLSAYPEIGRTGRVKGTRELVVQGTPFIIVYRLRLRLQRIEIIRLLHGAQMWPLPRERL